MTPTKPDVFAPVFVTDGLVTPPSLGSACLEIWTVSVIGRRLEGRIASTRFRTRSDALAWCERFCTAITCRNPQTGESEWVTGEAPESFETAIVAFIDVEPVYGV